MSLPYHQDRHNLPPTKIKRTYKCKICGHQTVNPRLHLEHRRDEHKQSIKIVECPLCVYACQYRQKLNRHLKLVHRCYPDLSPIREVYAPANSSQRRLKPPGVNKPDVLAALKEFLNQKTLACYGSTDEPMDLSYSQEDKQLIRIAQIKQHQWLEIVNYQA